MAPLRVLFLGTPAFAVPSLNALTERPDLVTVVGAISQPDRPAGRGRQLQAAPVKIAAEARGIPTLTPRKIKTQETYDLLAAFNADLWVVAAYGRILPPTLLALPRLGCINLHASLLPRWRGASPIAHAIAAGDPEAGVCIMQMEEGLDTGPVFSRRSVAIKADDTAGSLTIKLAELGAALLLDTLPGLASGGRSAVPQPNDGITYAKLLTKTDGALDFTKPAVELERQIRAFDPWPGTYAFLRNSRVAVLSAKPAPNTRLGEPGTVLEASAKGVLVRCGDGGLWLTRLKPEGRQAMDAAAWVAGRGVSVGDLFN